MVARTLFQIDDPTIPSVQGNDIGISYRSAIICLNGQQRRVAEGAYVEVGAPRLWTGNVIW